MTYLLIGFAVLAVLLAAARLFVSAEPATVIKALKIVGGVVLVAGLAALLLTGRLGWLIMILGGLLPWLMRMRMLGRRYKTARGPTPGQTSTVETGWLRMTLSHDTGEMEGDVLRGAFAGRRLSDLEFPELQALHAECRSDDAESARLLEAYVERMRDEDAAFDDMDGGEGAGSENRGGGASAQMGRDEAYNVLGLEPGASESDIKAAHRRLMQMFHPDRGGSAYLAARINQAKDILLGG